MKAKGILLLALALSWLAAGCVAMHDNYECELIAQESASGVPASGFPVQLVYPYDHYGIFYILNAPKTTKASLDKDGSVSIVIADFYFPHLVVGSTIFRLNHDVIKNGGHPFKFPYSRSDEEYQRKRKIYNAYSLSIERYPEVDVVISPSKSRKKSE